MAKLFRTVERVSLKNRRVVVRVDWNVTIGKALQIVDDTRIVRTLPTIRYLLDRGVQQVVLISHLGKPNGWERKLSLKPIVEYAAELLGREIKLFEKLGDKPPNQVVMLENLRFWPGEEQNDPWFARELAKLGEIYVNEAFGESHREVASIVGIPRYLPSYGGLWLAEEVQTLLKVRENPKHPYVVIMGGAKVEDKIKLIRKLAEQADTILLGGKLANEFIKQKMRVNGRARIVVPIEGSDLLDIGERTQKLYAQEIARAKTLIWNGPMGMVEERAYRRGTEAVYLAICKNKAAETIVGGGDTLSAISKEEHLSRIDHVSTGGGAMLKLLETGSLVGIEML